MAGRVHHVHAQRPEHDRLTISDPQTDEWRRQADGSWSGTFDVDVQGAPVHIDGTMKLVPDPDGSRHEVALDFQVKIPIVGGKIADWAGKNEGRRTLDAEFAFNDRRLGGRA